MSTSGTSLESLFLTPGTLIAKRYEICERVGSGGMGMVYLVIDRELNDEKVALKLLHPHLAQDEDVFRRFRNEVLVARSLSHPHIVRTHDIGRAQGGISYISMEYVDGLSLKEHLSAGNEDNPREQKALKFKEGIGIFCQVLSGVAYAHGKGVVHRDLKPANVLIDGEGEVKLADFGTARILGMDTSITRAGQVIGTPDYMSPEQIRGEELDAKCDIYALGILGYEMFNGDRPFVADSPVAVAFKHLNEPLPNLDRSLGDIPPWFFEILKKASAKDKNERFETVGEMLGSIFECDPELAKQSGMFTIEGTSIFAGAGASSLGMGTKVGGASSLKKNQQEDSPTQLDFQESFSIGDAPEKDQAKWTLDFEKETSSGEPPEQETEKPSNLIANLIFSFSIFAMFGAGYFHFHDTPEFKSMKEKILAKESYQNLLKLVTNPSFLTSTSSGAEQKQRSELENELLRLESGDSTDSPLFVVRKDTLIKSPTKADSKPETAPEVQVVPEPTVIPTPIPTPKPLVPIVGSLLFKINRAPLSSETLSINNFHLFRWEGLLRVGKGGRNLSSEDLKNKVWLNVFEISESKVIARLKPNKIEIASDAVKNTVVKGEFRDLLRVKPNTGYHRFDLIFEGEVLFSKKKYFDMARVTFSRPRIPKSVVGGSRISIVSGSEVAKQAEAEAEAKAKAKAKAEAEAEAEGEAEVKAEVKAEAGGEVIGLPPAKLPRGVVRSFGQRSEVRGSTGLGLDNYRGVFVVQDLEAGTVEEKKLLLELEYSGNSISGRAQIDGFGAFKVVGLMFPRGMELDLMGTDKRIRLISGRKSKALRGRYSILGTSVRGRWSASLR